MKTLTAFALAACCGAGLWALSFGAWSAASPLGMGILAASLILGGLTLRNALSIAVLVLGFTFVTWSLAVFPLPGGSVHLVGLAFAAVIVALWLQTFQSEVFSTTAVLSVAKLVGSYLCTLSFYDLPVEFAQIIVMAVLCGLVIAVRVSARGQA